MPAPFSTTIPKGGTSSRISTIASTQTFVWPKPLLHLRVPAYAVPQSPDPDYEAARSYRSVPAERSADQQVRPSPFPRPGHCASLAHDVLSFLEAPAVSMPNPSARHPWPASCRCPPIFCQPAPITPQDARHTGTPLCSPLLPLAAGGTRPMVLTGFAYRRRQQRLLSVEPTGIRRCRIDHMPFYEMVCSRRWPKMPTLPPCFRIV